MKAYLLDNWQMIAVAVLILVTSLFTGCTFLRDRPASARLVVSYAVGKYIESASVPAERALRVRTVAQQVAQYANSTPDVTIEALRAVAIDKLPPSLSPADRSLAVAVIDAVTEELKARVADGKLPGDILMNARSVLQWIAAATDPYLPKP